MYLEFKFIFLLASGGSLNLIAPPTMERVLQLHCEASDHGVFPIRIYLDNKRCAPTYLQCFYDDLFGDGFITALERKCHPAGTVFDYNARSCVPVSECTPPDVKAFTYSSGQQHQIKGMDSFLVDKMFDGNAEPPKATP